MVTAISSAKAPAVSSANRAGPDVRNPNAPAWRQPSHHTNGTAASAATTCGTRAPRSVASRSPANRSTSRRPEGVATRSSGRPSVNTVRGTKAVRIGPTHAATRSSTSGANVVAATAPSTSGTTGAVGRRATTASPATATTTASAQVHRGARAVTVLPARWVVGRRPRRRHGRRSRPRLRRRPVPRRPR